LECTDLAVLSIGEPASAQTKSLKANAKSSVECDDLAALLTSEPAKRANQKGQPSRARRLAEQKHCQVSALQIDWCFHLGFLVWRARRLAGRKRRRVVALQTPKKEKLQNFDICN